MRPASQIRRCSGVEAPTAYWIFEHMAAPGPGRALHLGENRGSPGFPDSATVRVIQAFQDRIPILLSPWLSTGVDGALTDRLREASAQQRGSVSEEQLI